MGDFIDGVFIQKNSSIINTNNNETETTTSDGTFKDGVFMTTTTTTTNSSNNNNPMPATVGTFINGTFIQPIQQHLPDLNKHQQPIITPSHHKPLSEIWMRDPFILPPLTTSSSSSSSLPPKQPQQQYLLFGTTDKPPDQCDPYSMYPATGFDVYQSTHLDGPWYGPIKAFTPPSGFWADTQFWAPEVIRYANSCFMIASFRSTRLKSGRYIQILKSYSEEGIGPYQPWSELLTPPNWFCLDGHIYLGEMTPYLIFAREFIEVGDGMMYCIQLSSDLKKSIGEPTLLFKASEAPWVRSIGSGYVEQQYVTDGPFLWRVRGTQELIMLWSSIGTNSRYQIGIARSKTGKLFGPYVHDPIPLFEDDGGHCMIFRLPSTTTTTNNINSLWNGEGSPPLVIVLHTPNRNVSLSRPKFFLLEEKMMDGKLQLKILNHNV
jgi:arabinan endo-1,5-alpha-L-arabinosidase